MNQANVMDMMLQYIGNMQLPGMQQPPKADSAPRDDFQQLIQQKQQSSKKPDKDSAKPGKTEQTDKPKAQEQTAETQDTTLEQYRQQLLAAQAASAAAMQGAVMQEQKPTGETEQAPVMQLAVVAQDTTVRTGQQETQGKAEVMPEAMPQETQQPVEKQQDNTTPVLAQDAPKEDTQKVQQTAHQASNEDMQDSQQQDDDRPEVLQASTDKMGKPLFHDVKAAPVKVGNTPVVDTESTDMDAQLAGQLDAALERGDSRVKIKLTPESLGTITVEMTHSKDGALHVAVHTSNERAASLLEKHATELENLLASTTQSSNVRVQVDQPQQSQQGQQQYQGQDGQPDQQQQEQHGQQGSREHEKREQDFLQQLRLGLNDNVEEVS